MLLELSVNSTSQLSNRNQEPETTAGMKVPNLDLKKTWDQHLATGLRRRALCECCRPPPLPHVRGALQSNDGGNGVRVVLRMKLGKKESDVKVPKSTKMDFNRPFHLPEWFDRGFLWSEIVCLWVFASPCRRDLAAFVWRNVKFPPGSQVWQPEDP